MSLTYHLQIVNLLPPWLLLISFAMLSQRRIAGLITLFCLARRGGWRRPLRWWAGPPTSITCITRRRSPWCSR